MHWLALSLPLPKRSATLLLVSLIPGLLAGACLRPGDTDGDGGGQGGEPGAAGAPGAGGSSNASGGNGSGGVVQPRTQLVGTDNYDCSAPEGDVPPLTLTPLLTGLDQPILVAHAPNQPELYVVLRTGQILRWEGGTSEPEMILDLGDKVEVGSSGGDERGLLGFAFHPEFEENGLVYLHYSSGAALEATDGLERGDTVIEEYTLDADGLADPESARLVLTVDQPANNHNGGTIAFGLDGFLYIGLGDGGGGGDPDGNGQNPQALLGKMLRIDPVQTKTDAYSIPDGNLQDELSEAAPEIWDMGLRNPFRFNFDGCNGDLYIGDVGQDEKEEIDIELVGDGRRNYGWNTMEGFSCYQADTCDETGLTLPMLEYDHNGANASVTGGAVYRGATIPALRGSYLYADFSSNRVWMTQFDRKKKIVSTPVSLTQELNVSSIVAIQNDSEGELLFVSLEQGTVFQLTAAE